MEPGRLAREDPARIECRSLERRGDHPEIGGRLVLRITGARRRRVVLEGLRRHPEVHRGARLDAEVGREEAVVLDPARAGRPDADGVGRRDRVGQLLGGLQIAGDLGVQVSLSAFALGDRALRGHDLDRALHPSVDVAVVRVAPGLGELHREGLGMLGKRQPRLDALAAGVAGLLTEAALEEGRVEADIRLAVEPERDAGGVVGPGDRLSGRQNQPERRPALSRDVDGVEPGRHELDGIADVDRRPVREEVVDVRGRPSGRPSGTKSAYPCRPSSSPRLRLAGTASTPTAAAIAAMERCDKGAPLGRNYVVLPLLSPARDLGAST